MFIAIALIRFDPSTTQEMLELAAKIEVYLPTEPGCLHSSIARSVSNENELLSVEIFDGIESFEKHAELIRTDPTISPIISRWDELKTGLDATIVEGTPIDISHIADVEFGQIVDG
ncbi:MAG TPA: antibiotic biosynthesis monooxygenase family protein [Baekduia sp.]|nr:antibiotic biosynthesis monooxygenase family protein [Baekduia sp.]